MDVQIDVTDRRDIVGQIYRSLRASVLEGRIRPDEQLPPTRDLAERLGVARTTVTAAYDRLVAEGFAEGRVGAGTFATGSPLPASRQVRTTRDRSRLRPLPRWRDAETFGRGDTAPEVTFDFAVGLPDPALFPLETWRRLVAAQLRASTVRRAGYGDPAGDPRLRAALGRYIGVSRAVRAEPDDIIVTSGAQQALDLVGRVMVEPGATVAVEEPGYPPAQRLFAALGARVVGVPVDDEGLVVAALPDRTRLVYTTPSHQFPLGVPLSLARRRELLEWARGRDAVVVEDDYDSEFRFSGRPLEPLQSLDRDGRVLYVGSFSKTMLPFVRLGFVVVPPALRTAVRTARQLSDWYGDPVAQGAMASFMDDGQLARHLRRTTKVYAARRDAVLEALHTDLAEWLEPVPSVAGLHLTARVRAGVELDPDAVARRVLRRDVRVETVRPLALDPATPDGFVLGYGVIDSERIRPGLRLLAQAIRHR